MNEGPLPHIGLAQAVAAFLLFAIMGPEPVWFSLRPRAPQSDPGASHSVAALTVPPDVEPAHFANPAE